MIIIDLQQVMIANLMVQIGNHTNLKFEESMVRHMVLNSIKSIAKKFKREYGEIVIACDSKNSWRRQYFPYYKANRRKDREASELDWNTIFQSLGLIRAELREYSPYRVIDVEGAEADDVIGTLAHRFGKLIGNDPKILIVSGDKDFIQLQVYSNVYQYSPVMKKWIQHPDPQAYLFEHIVKGDVGDGVPNVFSVDSALVTKTRQKPVTQKKLAELREAYPSGSGAAPEVMRNFCRNQTLIDLEQTPKEIAQKINEEFDAQEGKKSNLFNYFMHHKLRVMMENIQDF